MAKKSIPQSPADSKKTAPLSYGEQRKAILTAPDETWELILKEYLPDADPTFWKSSRANYDPEAEERAAKKRATRRKRGKTRRRSRKGSAGRRTHRASNVLYRATAELVGRVNGDDSDDDSDDDQAEEESRLIPYTVNGVTRLLEVF